MGLQPVTHNVFFRQLIYLALLITIGIVITKQLIFFVGSFLGAITIYIILRETLFRLIDKYRWRSWLASLVLVIGAAVMIIGLGYAVVLIIAPAIPDIDSAKILIELKNFVDKVNTFLGIDIKPESVLGQASSFLTGAVSGVLNSGYSFVANMFMTLVLLYFMLSNARSMEAEIEQYMPFKGNVLKVLKRESKAIIYSNAIGIPLVMFFQFLAAMLIYWLVGVDQPLFWAFVTAVCGLIPVVGTAIVSIPMAVHLIVAGHTVAGLILIAYGVLVISNIDNLCRIVLMKKMANTHPLIVIFGVIMGIPMFGFWGIIFGPLLLSLFLLLIKIYYIQYQLLKPSEDDELKYEAGDVTK